MDAKLKSFANVFMITIEKAIKNKILLEIYKHNP